ncbi:ATP-dependent DNA helicase UvrD, putative [Plasmodium vinckei vinckei]|uniref:DNA 3'-5' helicase n=1 Tax=Plasmodium vinckei vinckei TaxID=54757 RepID=A0A449BUX6_PLAVN|nr:ATP-dependent DNA helicase UvrD, putative [Plasmodium vinckei vinckei]VEV57265.1 ATP-dependent DNA helicase UvrD, putative [Plasmodium vinckei vinckei]
MALEYEGNSCNESISVDEDDADKINDDVINQILFRNLSEEQMKIVQVPLDYNLCIIACPGSGKTSTLTARIIKSIIERKKSIVCITFTNYSAKDLKEKIIKKINCLIDLCTGKDIQNKLFNRNKNIGGTKIRNKKYDINKTMYKNKFKVLDTTIFIGTIHSFCRYILLKYKGEFKILTESINSNVIKMAFNNFCNSTMYTNCGLGGDGKTPNDSSIINKSDNTFNLAHFINCMKNNISKNEEKKLEDEAIQSEGEDEEEDEYFFNYLYNFNSSMDKGNLEQMGEVKCILKKKEILFLKKKIKLLKYVELYNMTNIEINDIEKKFYVNYKKIFEKEKYIYYDFDDLLIETYKLMKDNIPIRNKILEEWNYMFCDEFQDINTTQFNILQFFANIQYDVKPSMDNEFGDDDMNIFVENDPSKFIKKGSKNSKIQNNKRSKTKTSITVIGDDDQSIYAFRGAHASVFKKIIKECNCLLFKLSTNFRSTKEIVRISNNLILNNGSCRINKKIYTNNIPGQKATFEIFKTNDDQISYVLAQIIFLKKIYNLKFSDFAILSRTNKTLKETLINMNKYEIKKKALKMFREFCKNLENKNIPNDTHKNCLKNEKQFESTTGSTTNLKSHEDSVSSKKELPSDKIKEEWSEVNIATFNIPIKELNKKKSFFGSKEIIQLITLLRFLINVNDDVVFLKSFKIIKNSKLIKTIIHKLANNHIEQTHNIADSHYAKDNNNMNNHKAKSSKENISFFEKVKAISQLHILSKRKKLSADQLAILNIFTENEIKIILDFFFVVNHFLNICSKHNSVYTLVMDILKKTNFIKKIMKKIEESAENTANTMNDEQGDLVNANNNSSHMENLIKCKSENDIPTVSHKSGIENNSKEKESTHINNDINRGDYQNVHGKKRTFEQCNDNAEIINNNNKENPNIINELEIKNNLKALFNINEEDYNYSQIQNIFIFLEITREYKPNLMEQTCYDCLICFLNDFKNNMHEKLLIEKVTLTTIHKSKGLEWKVVFIINVIEGEIPHVSANNNEIIEERKIFYVGITRAKYILYLLCYVQNTHMSEKNTISRFIYQMKL